MLGIYPDLFYKPIINYVENLYGHSDEIANIKQKNTSPILKISEQIKGNNDYLNKYKNSQVSMQMGNMSLLRTNLYF
jgi:hypothetical protein